MSSGRFEFVGEAIDAAARADVDALPAAEAMATLKTLKQSASRLDALIARLTHHVDTTGAVVGTGSRDAADWLARQTGTSTRKNRTAGELGAAMARSDELTEAVTSGSISSEKAAVVASAAADEIVDADLIERIDDLTLPSVKPIVEQWRAERHPDRDADVSRVQRTRRYLRLTDQADGMTRIDGLLDPTSASVVRSTLDSIVSESAFDGTDRTREQRASDALTQLCGAAAKGEIRGGRSNAKLLVTSTYESLCERASARGRTNVGTTIDAASVRALACDAGVHRVITGPGSSIINFGNQTRLVSDNQFQALVVRDQHCRWPGCTIRATWCDAHHIIEWVEGGATDLDNLALFCHHHHHLGHQPGWTVTGTGESIAIRHPNGGVDISRPPGHGVSTHRMRPMPPSTDSSTGPPGTRPNHSCADPIGRLTPDEAAPAQLTLA